MRNSRANLQSLEVSETETRDLSSTARTLRVSKIAKRAPRNSTRNSEINSKRKLRMPVALGELLLPLPQPRPDPNILWKRILLRQ